MNKEILIFKKIYHFLGWSGPTIALLMNNSSEISVTQHECNFIASIHPAGSVFGGK